MLPQWLLRTIWTQWFHMPEELYPTTSDQWLYHYRDFSKHDVVFEFQDYFGRVEHVRCSAQEFLTSPWAPPGQPGGTMACFVQSSMETGIDAIDQPWILGLVRMSRILDVPDTNTYSVRLPELLLGRDVEARRDPSGRQADSRSIHTLHPVRATADRTQRSEGCWSVGPRAPRASAPSYASHAPRATRASSLNSHVSVCTTL